MTDLYLRNFDPALVVPEHISRIIPQAIELIGTEWDDVLSDEEEEPEEDTMFYDEVME